MQGVDESLLLTAALAVIAHAFDGPEPIQMQIHAAGLAAFADGFAAASLLAAVMTTTTACLTLVLVRAADPTPLRTAMVRDGDAAAAARLH